MTYSPIALSRCWINVLRMTIAGLGRTTAVVAASFIATSTAIAHPNHPVEVVPADSPLHTFVQPSHAVLWGAFACGIWMVVQFRRRARKGRLAHQQVG